MASQFYNYFCDDDVPFVFVRGEKAADALLRILAQEAAKRDWLALLVATKEKTYPVEGKVLIAPDATLLMELFQDEQAELVYLAKGIKNDILQPYSPPELRTLFQQCQRPARFFVRLEKDENIEDWFPQVKEQCVSVLTLNFTQFESQILTVQSADQADEWVEKTLQFLEQQGSAPFMRGEVPRQFLFFDHVQSMLDENKLLSIFRNLKDKIPARIFVGQIVNNTIKEI